MTMMFLSNWLVKASQRFLLGASRFSTFHPKIVIHKEVSEALLKNKPVVALESTIITHGMPFPQNLKMARSVIEIVRRNGVVPATIAILNEELHVGLTRSELEFIAKMGKSAIKTSRRDIPAVLSKGLVGGTTVSGTMVAAAKAGIPVFVTGGIGGVHYGADQTFDVSADLVELGRTPVTVVCGGVKSILDIGLTLEYLETHGVTVTTFGNSLDFPAFFSPKSGFKVPYNISTPKEAASMIECNLELDINSGMVIAVPIPESHAPLGTQIETAIQQALQDAKNQGVYGKDITPFVLQRVNQLTEGKSLEANVALIQNNAVVGSRIAVELSKLRDTKVYRKSYLQVDDIGSSHTPLTKKQLVVIGGSNVDFTARANSDIIYHGATNVGRIQQTFGGVGRNIAECLGRIGSYKPLFISAVGGDDLGEMLLRQLESVFVSTYGVHVSKDKNTSTYAIVLDKSGDVVVGLGDMEAHNEITMQLISAFEEPILNAPLVIVDGNVEEDVIHYCIQLCKTHKIPVMFEPTCLMKAAKPFTNETWKGITFTTPNLNELRIMHKLAIEKENNSPEHDTSGSETIANNTNTLSSGTEEEVLADVLKECVRLCKPLMQYISTIIVTLGQHGVVVCRDVPHNAPFTTDGKLVERKYGHLVSAMHYPAFSNDEDHVKIVSVSGAGDSLTAAFLSCVNAGYDPDICVKAGLLAAWYSLQSSFAVPTTITPELFTVENIQNTVSCQPRVLDIDGTDK